MKLIFNMKNFSNSQKEVYNHLKNEFPKYEPQDTAFCAIYDLIYLK